MVPVTCVVYEPPRVGLPYLVVALRHDSDPIAKAFKSLAEAKIAVRAVSMRLLHEANTTSRDT